MKNVHRQVKDFSGQCRKASVTAMVLVVLVLTSGLLAEFVRRAATDHRHMRQEYLYQQTIHLADAGVERLLLKHRESDDYQKERWIVAAGTIHQTNTAEVTITVSGSDATVTARYPANTDHPCQVTRTLRLTK